MNRERRKQIDALINSYEADLKLKIEALIEQFDDVREMASDFVSDIEDIKSEEEEYKDNMPESLQQSDRYYAAEAAVEHLENAMEKLNEVLDFDIEALSISDDLISALDEAKA